METSTLITLLFTHWVADFIFQTDKQAKGKSTSWVYLTGHVFSYTLGLFVFAGFFFPEPITACKWVLANAALHWCTDWVTSRVNSKLYREGKIHWFFVSIGFDQFIHYTTLILTFNYFVK